MIKKEMVYSYTEYEAAEELSPQDRALLDCAVEARSTSYAPFSNFNVGAALLLEDGTLVPGSNQENAAFPECLCAERNALMAAHVQHPGKKILALAVTAKGSAGVSDVPVSPCGACRQSLVQAKARQQQPIRLILGGRNRIWVFEDVEALLPFGFTGF